MAKYYDLIELEENAPKYQNEFIKNFFKENNINTILDFTCGTGAQTIYLKKEGFNVTANDISKEMLEVAKKKAADLNIPFYNKDMRYDYIGKFDAVISLYNSIGHLTIKGFEKALKNISNNLNDNGYLIFDIVNYDLFNKIIKKGDEIIDVCGQKDNYKIVNLYKRTLSRNRKILHLKQKILIQEEGKPIQKFNNNWDMQLYSYKPLIKILENYGFLTLNQYNMHGREFNPNKSYFILTITQKKDNF